ncbi:MAG: biotin--[acetyl-CoA-carboxylase] ligase [Chloroflexi bacterium]|nr:biotin--[acetyl-CoA-carboxylase] ligase [Chloroflexota bacterium]
MPRHAGDACQTIFVGERDYLEQDELKAAMLRKLMAAGGFISGEEVSREMGVSRTAVWKYVRALRNDGCRIDAIPNRGYCLVEDPDLLLPFALKEKLKTKIMGRQVHHFDAVESTQPLAYGLAQKGAPDGALVVAEEQGLGRGRLGRSFFSPRGGLWFSLILKPDLPPQGALAITLLAGVAVAEAVQELAKLPVRLKWPNDVLIGDRKTAGILGEMIAEVDALRFVILGIGINVNIAAFPNDLKDIATSLSLELGRRVSRGDLLCHVMERFEHYYGLLLARGPGPVLAAWRALPGTLGCPVRAETPEGVWEGTAMDIDEQGALLIQTSDGIKHIMAGDVRLVREVGRTK